MEAWKAEFITHLASCLSLEEARKKVGISKRTVYHHKKSPTAHRKEYHRASPTLTLAMKRKLMYNFNTHPERPFRELAQAHGISEATVRRLAKEKGFKSVAQQEMPLEANAIIKGLIKASKALAELKKGRHGLPLIFSDKKLFVVDCLSNSRQDRLVIQGTFKNLMGPNAAKVNKSKFSFKIKHPAQVMVLGAVREDGGKRLLIFVPQGERLTAKG